MRLGVERCGGGGYIQWLKQLISSRLVLVKLLIYIVLFLEKNFFPFSFSRELWKWRTIDVYSIIYSNRNFVEAFVDYSQSLSPHPPALPSNILPVRLFFFSFDHNLIYSQIVERSAHLKNWKTFFSIRIYECAYIGLIRMLEMSAQSTKVFQSRKMRTHFLSIYGKTKYLGALIIICIALIAIGLDWVLMVACSPLPKSICAISNECDAHSHSHIRRNIYVRSIRQSGKLIIFH